MNTKQIFFCALVGQASAASASLDTSDLMASNPIRKVVNMLEALQKKVTAEGEVEAKLFDKFKCYCKTSGGTLSKSISEAETKVPSLTSDIEEAEAKRKQDQEDLKQAQADRADAKASMAQATALREKAAAEFSKQKAEYTSNLAALQDAITAIEKGVAGFVQTDVARKVRDVVINTKDISEFDRQPLVAFLSGTTGTDYVPQSNQIVGVLKEIKDTMSKSWEDLQAAEAASVSSQEELMTSKSKQVSALTKSIESKTTRVGSLAVQIVEMKEDLANTQATLDQDKHFLANMDHDCATKTSEYETNVKTRSDELLAIADAIKMLSSDDALQLFKTTLHKPSSSFLQMKASLASQRTPYALTMIQEAEKKARLHLSSSVPSLDFIALALHGKKVNFDKVVKMIDDMVSTLHGEQADDQDKKSYCTKQFDSSNDKKKGFERSAADLDTAISKGHDAVNTLKDEIEALENGIKALDKEVVEATEQRKTENKDYADMLASNAAAEKLLNMAKERLNKFYHPQKVAPVEQSIAFVQIKAHQQDAPAPPPETAGAYLGAKEEASDGALATLDTIIQDLEKEMQESELMERDSQKDYEKAMQDAADRRALSSKSLTDKGAMKASVETELEANKGEKSATTLELMATDKFIASLHAECDFLLQYFDVRKEARDSEIASLQSAKNLLSGMDISLVQLQEGRRLRGVA